MEKGIVCFSFDDGRKDNYEVAKLLLSKNIPASFNITSGYVDGTCPSQFIPCDKPAMCIEDIRWLYEQKIFDVALHGDQHQNSVADIKAGREKVIEWLNLPKDGRLGFASPGTGLNLTLINKEKDLFYNQISYVRISLRIKTKHMIRTFARKISRILPSPFLYAVAYKDTLMDIEEIDKLIYSVPVMGGITYKQVKALVDLSVRSKKALIIMLHSIETKPNKDDAWSWETDKFIKLCDYVRELSNSNQLEILTVQQLYDRNHSK